LEEELGLALQEGHSNLQELLSHDGQYFELDTIELIQASPAALLAQTGEQLAHHEVGNLIGTVEDDALDGDGLGEILGRLCLASTGWPSGVRTQLDMKGVRDGDPTPICKWSNDQSRCGTHVLVTVGEGCRDLLDSAVLSVLATIIFPIVFELLDPLEIVDSGNIGVPELLNDISSVDVCCDQGDDDLSLDRCQLTSNQLCEGGKLLNVGLKPVRH
jgi:hypothetical protein